MKELLTPEEAVHAAGRGWRLCWVYVQDTARWLVEITPTSHPANSVADAQNAVMAAARLGDKIAVRALQIVMQSLQSAPEKEKKK